MSIKRRKKTEEEKLLQETEIRRMWNMFLEIWEERVHKSEISGQWLGREALTTMFHHILSKSMYKSAKFAKENIILLTPDEHTEVENGYKSFPEIEKRRKELLEIYSKD